MKKKKNATYNFGVRLKNEKEILVLLHFVFLKSEALVIFISYFFLFNFIHISDLKPFSSFHAIYSQTKINEYCSSWRSLEKWKFNMWNEHLINVLVSCIRISFYRFVLSEVAVVKKVCFME